MKDSVHNRVTRFCWLTLVVWSSAGTAAEPKMRVTFSVKGKTIVVAKAEQVVNPLDGDLKRNVDLDMFGKIQAQRDAERANAEKAFDKGLKDADVNDAQPPDNPFRWD